MKMFLKTNDKYIDGMNPIEITLDQALSFVDKHPSDAICDDNFIGFENEHGQNIQFIKFDDGSWLIDVPILKNDEYLYSEQDNDLNLIKVKEIIKLFYKNENWRSLCNLTRNEIL